MGHEVQVAAGLGDFLLAVEDDRFHPLASLIEHRAVPFLARMNKRTEFIGAPPLLGIEGARIGLVEARMVESLEFVVVVGTHVPVVALPLRARLRLWLL